MSFLYPLGLIGLIGVPILIIIYILKNKYTEQVIDSTYIWTLSEKFLKRRKPISKLAGIISLILQILTVITASLIIAHPIINLENAARDYCFILDGTGSMNMSYSEGNTMFDEGINRIEKMISSAKNGSTYTLIVASNDVSVIYESTEDKEVALKLMEGLSTSDTESLSSKTIKYAQAYFNSNNAIAMYLVTNKDYEVENLELINVANDIVNYTIDNTKYVKTATELKITGEVTTYPNDAVLTVGLFIDDNEIDETIVDAKSNQPTLVEFKTTKLDFDKISLKIKNSDSLEKDNENAIYNIVKEHERSTLLVSDRPFYLTSALSTNGTSEVKVVSTSEYSASMRGYGLYIFDSFSPNEYPDDGSIWLFNISKNTTNLGFSYQDDVTLADDEYALLEYENAHSSSYKELTSGILSNKIYLNHYLKYSLYRNFTTLLSYEGYPMVFAGTNSFNNREVVFAFDLHQSNLPLLLDYAILINNFVDYSFPTIMEEGSYYAGDVVKVNVVSNCKSIKVISPSGQVSYMSINTDISEYVTSESGTYKFIVTIGEDEKEFKVYTKVPTSVSKNEDTMKKYKVSGTPSTDYRDGIYDNLVIVLVVLLIVLVADWGVYCYEQYQLR